MAASPVATPADRTSGSGTTRATAQLASQLRFSVMRLSRRLRQQALEGDITPSQLSALAVLVRCGRLTLSQLADQEKVQPPSITRIVESLLARGLVSRTPSDEDRRVTWVSATPAGEELVASIRRRRDAYLAGRLRALSAEDRRVLERAAVLLEQLIEDPV
jgi:DNA-binding MarR family transcriptional regulator